MNAGPDSTGCVTLKQSINLSEPQCLHLSQSGYTSTCPRVVLLSEETRHRNVELLLKRLFPISEAIADVFITVYSRKKRSVCDQR